MSNLERNPVELVCPPEPAQGLAVRVLLPRDVPLGGPRAMGVRRTLPQRDRTTIGAWCFADHYGPDEVEVSGGMVVPPHPHTGLQTVSWLFEGEILHRDSTGSVELVRPGAVNLMTAGRGISHSEVSTPETTVLHGVQLWVALPDSAREVPPIFEHAETTPFAVGDAVVRVFVGALAGRETPLTVFSPLLAAQIDLPPFGTAALDVDPAFEHGVLVDAGPVEIEAFPEADETDASADGPGGRAVSTTAQWSELACVERGARGIRLTAEAEPVRVVLLGGTPFGEELVMWWNFIGRSHEEVAAFRAQWEREVIAGQDPHGRFGTVAGYDGRPLPAPELPTVRLKPRR